MQRNGALWIVLALLLAAGATAQALILSQALRENPFATTPINDAAVYWSWAGDVAAGKLVGSTPFLSAPLYPYLVGCVRWAGGGLETVYALQATLYLATALLLYRVAARRFEPAVGVLAVAIYLGLQEPAFFTGRVLNCTLQAFVVALLWDRMLALQAALAAKRERVRMEIATLAVVLGLNVLANPTMLVAVPLVAFWVYWQEGRDRRALLRGLGTLALSTAVVAPATVHNYLACGELIPVCAQAGVTFYHGNSPGADGTYKPVPGISPDRIKQNVDARELVREKTGGTWRGASAHFLEKGLAFWSDDPAAAARLFARKLYWFASARNYGDIYLPALEIEQGFASRLRWVPLPVAWWTLCALAILALLLRAPSRFFPEALLVGVPLLTVAVFWYSPRYRFPAVPCMCVLAAQALVEVMWRRGSPERRWLFGASLLIALALGPLNERVRFDRLDTHRATFEQVLGTTLATEGRLDEALAHHQRAHALGDPDAAASAGDVLRKLGRDDSALDMLREAVRRTPENAYAHKSLAVALAERGELAEAESEFNAALHADPNDWESISGLGNVLLTRGETERAIERYREALRLNPAFDGAQFNLGCALKILQRTEEAEAALKKALELNPRLVAAHVQLADLHVQRGDFQGAVRELRAASRIASDDTLIANDLAWHLATAPDDAARNGKDALEIAQGLARITHGEDVLIQDTLAAALAENGRFEEAAETLDAAIARLSEQHSAEELAELYARRDLYQAKRPFRQTRP